MALSKQMEVGGMPVSYHRVVSVTQVVNVQTTIEVGSYASAESRAAELAEGGARVQTTALFVEDGDGEPAYAPEMDAAGAYGYLKGLPEFEGAKDC